MKKRNGMISLWKFMFSLLILVHHFFWFIAGNAEQVPAESMSPKLFKADSMLFGNPYNFPNM